MTTIELTVTKPATVWTQADQDHLMRCIGQMEETAWTAMREKDDQLRAELTAKLRDHLETIRDIQYAAQNSAVYIAERLHMLARNREY